MVLARVWLLLGYYQQLKSLQLRFTQKRDNVRPVKTGQHHFIIFILLFILLPVITMTTVGCKKSSISSEGGPVLVQIPNSNNGNYEMQVVELTTIRDLTHLDGDAARFYVEPSFFNNEVTGENPNLRLMKTKDDVYVALDSLSLQLLALYYQFEKLMVLDQALGVKTTNVWPQKVAVNARIISNEEFKENNAAYSSAFNVFLFVPYTNPDLPLMVNVGVVGHEHFHSLFDKMVIAPLGQKFPT